MIESIFLIYGVAAIIYLIVMYLVINIATKTDKRTKYEWAQLELLAKIARVQGVPEEEIKATFKAIS